MTDEICVHLRHLRLDAQLFEDFSEVFIRLSRLRLRTSSYVGHVSFRLRPVRQAQGYGGQVDDYRPT